MDLARAASQLMTVPGAAEYIGVDPKTAWTQINRGRLASVQTRDGKRLVSVLEADRYLREHAGRVGQRLPK